MASKNLNFSLEGDFAPQAATPRDSGRSRAARAAGDGNGRAASAAPRQHAVQWLFTAVALANMLFLLLAAVWLTGHQRTPVPERPEGAALIRMSAALQTLQQSDAASRKALAQLQEAVQAQQTLLAAVLAAEPAPDSDAPTRETAAGEAAAGETWQINLGSFAAHSEALALQRRLQAIGYRVVLDAAGEDRFSLHLPGLDSRETAERSANNIMAQTSLNGLWVGASE